MKTTIETKKITALKNASIKLLMAVENNNSNSVRELMRIGAARESLRQALAALAALAAK